MTELDDQREALGRLAVHHLNAELATRVQRLARPALRLRGSASASGTTGAGATGTIGATGARTTGTTATGAAGTVTGRSRLGGDPLLAAGTPWPRWGSRPLSFLALIDLAEV